jgi:hypothetical protein
MFVSRTRNSGMPCRSPLFGSLAENFIRNHLHNLREQIRRATPLHALLKKSIASESQASFYIDDAEEGEFPFLCTPSPETCRYSQTG